MTSKVEANCTSFQMDNFRLALFAVELSTNTGVIFMSIVLGILLKRTRSFGRNPKVLLSNHQLASFNIACTRFILIPQMLVPFGLLPPSIIGPVQWCHDFSINVNIFIQLAITLECFFSTFYSVQWELFTSHFWVSIFTFFWPWACTGLLYYFEQIQLLSTIPQFICLFLLNIFCSIIFCFLYVSNRRKYKKMNAGDLTCQYKIILYFKPLCDYYAYLISSHAYDLISSFYNLLLIMPLVLTHEKSAKHFRHLLGIHGSRGVNQLGISTNPNGPTTMDKNAFGEHIIGNNSDQNSQQLAEEALPCPPICPNNQSPDNPSQSQHGPWPTAAQQNGNGNRRMVEVEIPGGSNS